MGRVAGFKQVRVKLDPTLEGSTRGFHDAVNVTLGLPFIRTSVDHGTALDIAGTGKADINSLYQAILIAKEQRIS